MVTHMHIILYTWWLLAHLWRRWSLNGREGFGFGGIQHFSGNETPIFHCARDEETKANGAHRGDRTRPVSAQCLRASRSCDRTRWRIRSRVEAYWKRPDVGTVASGSSSVRVRLLTRWSAARLDQRVRSVTGPARPVVLRAWVVCAPACPVSSTSASGQRDCSRIKCLTTSSCWERL
jgi:hypothetical protein